MVTSVPACLVAEICVYVVLVLRTEKSTVSYRKGCKYLPGSKLLLRIILGTAVWVKTNMHSLGVKMNCCQVSFRPDSERKGSWDLCR